MLARQNIKFQQHLCRQNHTQKKIITTRQIKSINIIYLSLSIKLEYINYSHINLLYISIIGFKINYISTSSWSTAHKEYLYRNLEFIKRTTKQKNHARKINQKVRTTNCRGHQVHPLQKHTPSRVITHLFSLKLCNFYLDSDKNIKLGDFGFACQLSH